MKTAMYFGTKTHPLSEHARSKLQDIARKPVPCSLINAGVVNRLLRESLVEMVELPSPFQSHKGAPVSHLQVTAAGLAAIASK